MSGGKSLVFLGLHALCSRFAVLVGWGVVPLLVCKLGTLGTEEDLLFGTDFVFQLVFQVGKLVLAGILAGIHTS